MFCLNSLKLYEKFIESGWIKVNADGCVLSYFLISIVAFDRCSKRCVPGHILAIELQANSSASKLLPRCTEDNLSLVEVILRKSRESRGCFEQSVCANVYVCRTSEFRVFGGDAQFKASMSCQG